MSAPGVAARVLGAAELEALAREVAADPAAWASAVEHRADRRTYALLRDDASVTVWLICWSPGHDTGFHDHDRSSAGIAVAAGEIVDERLALRGEPVRRRLGVGQATTVEPAEIHRIHHAGDAPAVSVHAYSPPLRRTGAYEVADDGRLLRFAQDGDEELAPRAAG
ncbi:cysteine dioxygenase family protein [Patulibacter sp. SYSU D01012]|uniref:cysteine dioxygenase n=1 Tax=Patulibacter sp. SYSU D01012 TaxID=2817381 RepID=UPI001B315161